MKARLFRLFVFVVAIALLLALLPGGILPVTAQQPQPTPPIPPHEPSDGGEAYQNKDGLWVMPVSGQSTAPVQGRAPKATGGPDQFGYTWNDTVALSWIDATTGIDTGMSGGSREQKVGPIPLPFSFKYYENTYTNVYIAASGYLAFGDQGTWPTQPSFPSPTRPNNIVAPWATPIYLNSTGPTARVYYTSSGTAPNRYFVVEWYDVKGGAPSDTTGNDETYRFEVILHENGDIVFQYQTMTYSGSVWCASAGIEDSEGFDGLAYRTLCGGVVTSNKAVRFYRPAPSARVSVYPIYDGRFSANDVQMYIHNSGEFGADTYDLTISSTWTASLCAADGTTPLTDTDSDGAIDTGSLAQGSTFTITVRVQTPPAANVGDANTATLTTRSSQDISKQKASILQTAVPASFAQVYRDDVNDAMSLYLVRPTAQVVKKTTADNYFGNHPAIAEMPSSFAYLWYRNRSVGSLTVREIEYTLLDHGGNTTRAVTRLTDHSGATVDTSDYRPAVAVAPNGSIGVLWYRYLWNSGTSQFNYNIYFAVLDAAGNVVVAPTNLTNNTTWGTSGLNVPYFFNPRIVATGDNRFILAWEREYQESAGWVKDVYYTVRDTSGGEVKAVTKFTSDTAGSSDDYDEPTLASIAGNRALLAFEREGTYSDIYFGILDSSGNVVQGMTNLSNDGTTVNDWGWPDAIQLSNGRILVAWTMAISGYRSIRFAVLDSSYNTVAGPTQLTHVAATTGNSYVSVTADNASRAVLTWIDYSENRNLYYALVDGNGSVLTQPMIFRSSSYIVTGSEGYGNTSYSPWRLYLPLILR